MRSQEDPPIVRLLHCVWLKQASLSKIGCFHGWRKDNVLPLLTCFWMRTKRSAFQIANKQKSKPVSVPARWPDFKVDLTRSLMCATPGGLVRRCRFVSSFAFLFDLMTCVADAACLSEGIIEEWEQRDRFHRSVSTWLARWSVQSTVLNRFDTYEDVGLRYIELARSSSRHLSHLSWTGSSEFRRASTAETSRCCFERIGACIAALAECRAMQ